MWILRISISLSLYLGFLSCLKSQALGGKSIFEFTNGPVTARVTALGGSILGVLDDDVALAYTNPAQINEAMHQSLTFAQNIHFADIGQSFISYGRHIKKLNLTFHGGFFLSDFGSFQYTDVLGQSDGSEFAARETALFVGVGGRLNNRMTGGINLKTIFGQMETYNATASACDIGLNYVNDSSRIVISLIVKNLGFVFSQYSISEGEMPFDIQLGISKKLKHLPFRFSIIGHQLHKANIRYDDPNLPGEVDAFGNPTQSSGFNQAIDNVFRHMIFSGEFLLGRHENLRLRIGYNHLRRKELSVSSFRSLAGFSTGFGIKIKQFRLDYGIGYYHLAGATNHITISTNFKSFRKDI